jgi:hypothetical protein
MTPKEQYEARKAERRRLSDEQHDYQERQKLEGLHTMDLLDRFVTAVERIADELEARSR